MSNIYLIGYTGECCPKCGRVRIEKWSDGLRICEKCGFCIEENSYHDRDKDFEDEREGERQLIHGCSFASEECKKNPCADCGVKEGGEK